MSTKKIPHIELHCHLDGSVRPKTILDIAKKDNINLPTYVISELNERLIAPLNCKSLPEYLDRFDIPNKVMQSKENLKRICYELFEDASKENIKYMEVRFAPHLHTELGLSLEDIISSVVSGMHLAEKKYDIKGNIILCCMRHLSEEKAFQVIEAGRTFINNGVVAVDLAGIELPEFPKTYVNAFKTAKSYGYRITVHAGETGNAQNVIDSINLLGAERIGHGVYIKDSYEAYSLVKSKNIFLEMCPTSNVQTKAVTTFNSHPFKNFLDDNVLVTLNTDNRTVSNTTMTNEFKIINDTFSLMENDYKKVYYNSINASFANDITKDYLKKLI